MAWGAAFQTLFPSFKKDDWERRDLPLLSWSRPFVVDLKPLAFGSILGTLIFKGVPVRFNAFHISVSLIWAFILFTKSMFTFEIRVSVLILSLILFEFGNLIILFWTNWIAWRSWFWVSEFDIWTFPSSWSPYLIFELNRLTATFVRDFLFRLLFSLIIVNSLWLREEITPPLPWIWSDQHWSLWVFK